MSGGHVGGVAAVSDDARLVGRLRDGDERAFEELVTALYPVRWSPSHAVMFAIGRSRTRSCRKAWLAVLNGLDRFEGRSSLRTWVLRIVANIAHDRGAREARSLPFSSLDALARTSLPVEPERFLRSDEPFPGGWRSFPTDWRTLPESRLLSRGDPGPRRSSDRVSARLAADSC